MFQKQTGLGNFWSRYKQARKAYPDPDHLPVEPFDAHAVDAAAEQTQFNQDTARRAGIKRSAPEARSFPISRQFVKSLPR